MKVLFVIICISMAYATAGQGSLRLRNWATKQIRVIGRGYESPCQVLEGGNASHSEGPPTTRKKMNVFIYVKDEKELLPDWLQYHSFLFGIKQINIIDHSSTNTQIQKVLALYSYCGAKVSTFSGNFSEKGNVLSEHMRKYNASFLIPLDADEFVVTFKKNKRNNGSTVLIDRDRILDEINNSPIDGRKYKFNGSLPVHHSADTCTASLNGTGALAKNDRRVMAGGTAGQPQYEIMLAKMFYYSKGFMFTDQGNHYGGVKRDRGVYGKKPETIHYLSHYFHTLPKVSILHYTACSYAQLKAKILRGAEAYGFHKGQDCLTHGKEYCKKAQDFRAESQGSKDYYMRMCARTADTEPSVAPLTQWFASNALTLDALVGP